MGRRSWQFTRSLMRWRTIFDREIVYFSESRTFSRSRFGQNQGLWRHFTDRMSLCLHGVFRLMKRVTFRRVLPFYNVRKWGRLQMESAGLAKTWNSREALVKFTPSFEKREPAGNRSGRLNRTMFHLLCTTSCECADDFRTLNFLAAYGRCQLPRYPPSRSVDSKKSHRPCAEMSALESVGQDFQGLCHVCLWIWAFETQRWVWWGISYYRKIRLWLT